MQLKHEILRLNDRSSGRDLVLGAQAACLQRRTAHERDTDLWEHEGLGITRILGHHGLALEVPSVRDAETLGPECLQPLFSRALWVGDQVPAGLEAGITPL